jgi:RNA polymerase sigma-70 factor (ECF subfamily)
MPELVPEAQLMQIYWDTVQPLYGYVSRRCGGDRELAEDVTQEAWFRAIREWRVRGLPAKPLAWLMSVSRNLIIDQLRRREHVSLDAVAPADVLAAVDDGTMTQSVEIASLVTAALARLSQAEAQLLEAFHFERFKVAQLATTYGVSERAIEGRLRRARARLRHQIELSMKAEGGLA